MTSRCGFISIPLKSKHFWVNEQTLIARLAEDDDQKIIWEDKTAAEMMNSTDTYPNILVWICNCVNITESCTPLPANEWDGSPWNGLPCPRCIDKPTDLYSFTVHVYPINGYHPENINLDDIAASIDRELLIHVFNSDIRYTSPCDCTSRYKYIRRNNRRKRRRRKAERKKAERREIELSIQTIIESKDIINIITAYI
jgi:hypothetical protein